MFRKMFSYASVLLLAAVVVLVTPDLSMARPGGHGGGGHGGGGHGGGGGHFSGGGHFGGGGFGGYHGGAYHGTYHGGMHYGNPRGYYPNNGYHYEYRHDGDRHRRYFGYGYYPYYYGSYPYYGPGYTYDSGYYGVDGTDAPAYVDVNPPSTPPDANADLANPPAQTDTVVHLTVNVPADARLFVEGKPMTTTGAVRQFDSPPLTPGQQYRYVLEARWNDNGHEVTQTQRVEVIPGANVSVSFPIAQAAGQIVK